jgi:hypothetical protein
VPSIRNVSRYVFKNDIFIDDHVILGPQPVIDVGSGRCFWRASTHPDPEMAMTGKRQRKEGGNHVESDEGCAKRRGANVSEEKIRLLVEWLRQKGAKMDAIKVAEGEHGVSVFAARDIGEDEVMACIPRHIALGATQVTLLLVA